MHTLAAGTSYADLMFQGLPRIIATAFLTSTDGIVVIDPGPSTSLPALERHLAALGAQVADVTAVWLTHIHLDHAGATGTLLRKNPRLSVVVHEVGAPHMADPSRLLASAGRLYGDQMGPLWGEVLPVPVTAIRPVRGGEVLTNGGRPWRVAYTPGHASHHVSFFSPDTGIAFVGDTAGVQVMPGGFVLPPTPPPDIDVPQWLQSLATIEAWRPSSLVLTHFGPTHTVASHLAELRDHLQMVDRFAREAMTRSGEEPDQEAWFTDRIRMEMTRRMGEADLRAYQVAGRFDLNWRGLRRFVSRGGR
ncbi:MAG: MBL fold metallo-hydrolase [Acidobacteria bacterium]|nr:MBL fold metallo-hydrolase [Acidobacteriota bacterium]